MTNQQKHKLVFRLFLVEAILFAIGIFGAAILDVMISNGWIALLFAAIIFLGIMPIIAFFMIKIGNSIDYQDECFKIDFETQKYYSPFTSFEDIKHYMERNVFAKDDYCKEITETGTKEPVHFYIKKFGLLEYQNIYVLIHLKEFREDIGHEICKIVEGKLKEEYEYRFRTAVYFVLCIDAFSDEFYKFYDMTHEEILVRDSLRHSFLPVAFSCRENIMYMGVRSGFRSSIYSNMKEEFPKIFNFQEKQS